jgi:hypothetical protein
VVDPACGVGEGSAGACCGVRDGGPNLIQGVAVPRPCQEMPLEQMSGRR